MKTVLIAGGAGFIGSHLCKKLLEEKYSVICVDNFLTSSGLNIKPFFKNKNFSFLEADIAKPLPHNLKFDFLFHLASPASPNHHSLLSYHALPMQAMMANTVGTHLLLEKALENKARFLFASTSEVYGDPLEHPQKETYRGNVSTTGPRSVYDEAKRFGETLVAYYARDKHLDTRITRIFNTYGPNMQKEDRRMIVDFINQSLKNNPITIFGNGNQTRSLCFVDDLIEGLIKFMFDDNLKGEILNLGSENEYTVLEYAKIIKKLTNSKSEIIFSEDLPTDDPLKRKADITKAKKLLNWKPKVELIDGLKNTIEYFKNL